MQTITLAKPIPYGTGTLDKIVLRDPSSGDLRGVNIGDIQVIKVDTILRLIPRLSVGVALIEEQLDHLHPYDFNQLARAVVDFFGKPEPPSPTTPSAPTES